MVSLRLAVWLGRREGPTRGVEREFWLFRSGALVGRVPA